MDDTTIESQPTKPQLDRWHKLLQFSQQADWTISRLISFVLNAAVFISLFTLGISTFVFEMTNIFEYQRGLADISTIEWVFMIGSLFLVKRYWSYSKQTSVRWWTIVTAPIIWYGKFILVAVLCAGVIAVVDLYEGTEYFMTALLEGQNYDQLLSLSAIWLSIYISVPSQQLITQPETDSHSPKANNEQITPEEPEVENVQ
ncbi:hypothetical protein [Vibrio fluvialis]|uniref:hypothetical protein n=1 Tax=Vibrio fluvialis TaxID=676 RepID=UPI0028DF4A57|nr:hypothetical protein [Vibrio fluvialis]MDT8868527.1 hypothetical protein [Vibrio fluvialis]MDT8875954.1 hypothetical protein [Vibrio fluvialis]